MLADLQDAPIKGHSKGCDDGDEQEQGGARGGGEEKAGGFCSAPHAFEYGQEGEYGKRVYNEQQQVGLHERI